jgi:D-alanyl-lipoteichoic acid acyltransferase DltB (MBOAT superfamily)
VIFSSYEFVLVFLPAVVLAVFCASALRQRTLAKLLLFGASLAFYAWWNPRYVLLLLALLGFNFTIGSWLIRSHGRAAPRLRLAVATAGVIANIGVLVYFKYANFFVGVAGDLTGWQLSIATIVLPLGISFITFQKIAFLVDAYGGQIQQLSLLDYGIFVTFFPQLIAGPIVHHREVIPQLQSDTSLRYNRRLIPIAVTFFVIGACKKVLIADRLSPHVAAAFTTASAGGPLDGATAWLGALGYTLQVYFDFSGYSDMAIGLGLLFGIRLPFNFNSPLKAISIIDFWSRWHMTLTRFLTAYLYNPIVLRATRRWMAAGKKVSIKGVMPPGALVRLLAIPTMITMAIAGLWHGAGWQFIAFGAIHGAYLVINHAWRNFRLRGRHGGKSAPATPAGIGVARAATLLALLLSIPFFRADSVTSGGRFVTSMLGAHGVDLRAAAHDRAYLGVLALVFLASQVLPNTQELLRDRLEAATAPLARHPGAGRGLAASATDSWAWPRVHWKPTVMWALMIGALGWYVVLQMATPSEFLYFQF